MLPGPASLFNDRLSAGTLRDDPAQRAGLDVLEATFASLSKEGAGTKRPGWWRFGRQRHAADASAYLYGPVGRGKSLIMDLFVEALSAHQRVQRVHFHAFILSIHRRIHTLQNQGAEGDPLPKIAAEIAEISRVLCFDEFVVNNIADAMILGRLFEALWGEGMTLIATSNFAPDALYKDGLHRSRFLPFIALINARMSVTEVNGGQDYRRLEARSDARAFHPLSAQTRLPFEDAYKSLVAGTAGKPGLLKVGGRQVSLPYISDQVMMARFDDLCARPLGAADYLKIAEAFPVVALDDIPILTSDLRNEASRFKVLIDTLYEAGTLLILRAAAPMDKISRGPISTEFSRTLSRLAEMQSKPYISAALSRLDPPPQSSLSTAQARA